MKTQYREVKDNNNQTGRGRKSCKFFRELDEILGHRPASSILDTGKFHSESQEGVTPIGAVSGAVTAVKIFDHRNLAMTPWTTPKYCP